MMTRTEDGYFVYTRYYQTKTLVLDTLLEVRAEKCKKEVKATWDTGASRTIISNRLAECLRLEKIADTKMTTASGETGTKKYYVDLILPNGCTVKNVVVMSGDFGETDVDVLLGMDIITLGDFAISNLEGNTVFSFRMPPGDIIDFARR